MKPPHPPKVIIQIPCYNEEETIRITLADLPRHIPGCGRIEWLIIDDGCSDRTVQRAHEHGADHIVSISPNKGLANAFSSGLEACLRLGADIIVNTDADNQYCGADIPKLIEPIIEGRAEIVVGARPIQAISHFSPIKKRLQRIGSRVVRAVSATAVEDAPSGFRAISRDAAMKLQVFGKYTYTLETIIQAGQKDIPIVSVPIRVNEDLRPSRLVRSTVNYVWRSAQTIVRIFALYQPFRFFFVIGAIPALLAAALTARWVVLYFVEYGITGRTHLPSLIAAAVLAIFAAQIWIFGFVADLIRANRMIAEDVRYRLRRLELGVPKDAGQKAAL
jgi:glycosyltransferase involved in cell wall biosynthesis